jgi:uncharacterized membrane protein
MLQRFWNVVCAVWIVLTAAMYGLVNATGKDDLFFTCVGLFPMVAGWVVVPVYRYVRFGVTPITRDQLQPPD